MKLATILSKDQYPLWDAFAHAHPYSSIHQTSRWAHFQSNVPSRDKFWIITITDSAKTTDTTNPTLTKNTTNPTLTKNTTNPALTKNSTNSAKTIALTKNTTNSALENPSTNRAQQIQAGTILIKHTLPQAKYCWLYSPRGPLLDYNNPPKAKEQLKSILKEIKKIAKEENAIFYRMDPLVPHSKHNKNTLKFPHFHFSEHGFQPKDTLILDLTKPQNAIMQQMKQKGRYNIRLAERKGVKVIEVTPPPLRSRKKTVELIQDFQQKIESYYKILQETLERDKFYGHRLSFYQSMVEKLSLASNTPKKELQKGFAKLYLAEYTPPETHKTQYIAGIIVTFFKDTAIYYYGASSNEFRNVMAPYLLQWHAIKEAKSIGCKEFDFLGIAPPTKKAPFGPKHHPWHGVTEFKRKFGGEHIRYLPAQEFSFKPFLHLLYKVAKTLRKILR